MSNPKFPNITVNFSDADGNVFNLLGKVRKAMLRCEECSKEDIEAFLKDATSGDYDHSIQTCMKTVNII